MKEKQEVTVHFENQMTLQGIAVIAKYEQP
jgi:hypothetical protein